VQTISKTETSEYRLLLRETVQVLDAVPLQKLGLTNREAEVLLWVSQGKSNAEIAIILASKVRTVAKHLERVFAKLMVENRYRRCACRSRGVEVLSMNADSVGLPDDVSAIALAKVEASGVSNDGRSRGAQVAPACSTKPASITG